MRSRTGTTRRRDLDRGSVKIIEKVTGYFSDVFGKRKVQRLTLYGCVGFNEKEKILVLTANSQGLRGPRICSAFDKRRLGKRLLRSLPNFMPRLLAIS